MKYILIIGGILSYILGEVFRKQIDLKENKISNINRFTRAGKLVLLFSVVISISGLWRTCEEDKDAKIEKQNIAVRYNQDSLKAELILQNTKRQLDSFRSLSMLQHISFDTIKAILDSSKKGLIQSTISINLQNKSASNLSKQLITTTHILKLSESSIKREMDTRKLQYGIDSIHLQHALERINKLATDYFNRVRLQDINNLDAMKEVFTIMAELEKILYSELNNSILIRNDSLNRSWREHERGFLYVSQRILDDIKYNQPPPIDFVRDRYSELRQFCLDFIKLRQN